MRHDGRAIGECSIFCPEKSGKPDAGERDTGYWSITQDLFRLRLMLVSTQMPNVIPAKIIWHNTKPSKLAQR